MSLNNRMKKLGFGLVFLMSWGGSALAQRNHYEDLAPLRPRVSPVDETLHQTVKAEPTAVKPTHHVTGKVNSVLDSINRFNLTRRYVDGVTIQIYSGAKREEALNARKKLTEYAPDLGSNLMYQQPKFRVTVGAYYTSLEAQKDFQRLKRAFPNAILIPEKMPMK